jgi:hypothetical protein
LTTTGLPKLSSLLTVAPAKSRRQIVAVASQIQHRQPTPDFDKTLEQKVNPAAQITLHRARHHADDGA